MKNFTSKLKIFGSTFAIAMVALVASANFAAAQGPDVVFNNGSGVAGIGEEKDFLRIGDANGGNTAEACTEGQNVNLWFYVHNTNPTELNGPNLDSNAVAKNTKVDLNFKNSSFANSQEIDASVQATNSALASDNAFITCQGQAISLEYVSQSLFTNAPAFTSPYALTGSIMDSATLGYDGGVVPGCFEYRAFITVIVKVHVKPVVVPVYSCDLLTVSKLADNKYRFTVTYTAKDGATFKNVSYDFGDGAKADDDATIDHTYVGSNDVKNVTATVNFTVDGAVKTATNANCAKQVTLTKENCTIPGKENLPKNSPDCKKIVVKTSTLPDTGPGGVVAAFVGASFIGAFLYRMRALRSVL